MEIDGQIKKDREGGRPETHGREKDPQGPKGGENRRETEMSGKEKSEGRVRCTTPPQTEGIRKKQDWQKMMPSPGGDPVGLGSDCIFDYIRNLTLQRMFAGGKTIRQNCMVFWATEDKTETLLNASERLVVNSARRNREGKYPAPACVKQDMGLLDEDHPRLFDHMRSVGLEAVFMSAEAAILSGSGGIVIVIRKDGAQIIIHEYGCGVPVLDASRILEAVPELLSTPPIMEEQEDAVFINAMMIGDAVSFKRLKLYAKPLASYLETNYCGEVVGATNRLIRQIGTRECIGRTVILQGPPGTGKSYWIKGLAKTLEKMYVPVLVVQPMNFFSTPMPYLHTVDRYGEDGGRLMFIFEDCGRMLATEAQMDMPQVESLLLNISDGLLGSGREDIFVFTFNFEVGSVIPAIQRPGRLLAGISFAPLNGDEIARFVASIGGDGHGWGGESKTLAELYSMALLGQGEEAPRKKAMGFLK